MDYLRRYKRFYLPCTSLPSEINKANCTGMMIKIDNVTVSYWKYMKKENICSYQTQRG